ncbi:transcriptional regulator of molybdate metabolism, XRE family [Desulfocicer vacuolatum DSM 3385]|uniref:Transcriptional regulator of molybdate metabolism, XRE family n=1 Tax=Desulfocicer vacuolatum DSM 3385 TaxID=1121400 RepID=A0A1W2DIX4_9BACT|nr:substrate-binding domain-containing protein [Desulfocicer vacuolatum]SMC97461.1 transcriptional regulator of molybdate metabolism, XRE family [Desulfocicer vacuolatum DSM 3385]
MSRTKTQITCHVKAHRQSKGWSQSQLADRIGVKRQAIYDIESGRYLPNTAVALKLARHFGCRVEDLFVDEAPGEKEAVVMVGTPNSQRISATRVRGRLVGFPLNGPGTMVNTFTSADAILSDDGSLAELLCPPDYLEKSILLMGCDPAFDILSSHVARIAPDARINCRFATSHLALKRLGQGYTHIAGTHLHNRDLKESNVSKAVEALSGDSGIVVGFSMMEEGLMVARGNPLNIKGLKDLVRSDVRFINRDHGAALRVLLDDLLQRAGIPETAVNGYENLAYSHTQGARAVNYNLADAALGLRVIAHAFDMDFVTLDAVRCDLVIPSDMMALATVKVMLDVLQSRAFRQEIVAIPGYETGMTGKIIAKV